MQPLSKNAPQGAKYAFWSRILMIRRCLPHLCGQTVILVEEIALECSEIAMGTNIGFVTNDLHVN